MAIDPKLLNRNTCLLFSPTLFSCRRGDCGCSTGNYLYIKDNVYNILYSLIKGFISALNLFKILNINLACVLLWDWMGGIFFVELGILAAHINTVTCFKCHLIISSFGVVV